MAWKRKMGGGIVAVVGFMLSPLSWWNDLFVNLPIAVAFGWLISLLYRPAFEPAVIAGYWLTNVAGLVLMHKGAQTAMNEPRRYRRTELLKDLAISIAYTGLILLLLKFGALRPVQNYFS